MRLVNRRAEALASVCSYSFCSICMIIFNKLVLHTFDLNYPNAFLFVQNGAACLFVSIAKHMGYVSYPALSLDILRRWIPLTLLFVLMLYTSMKSLHLMSVSAQTIVKNLAIIATATGDRVLYNKVVTPGMYGSFCLMMLGSYLGAKGDPWVTAWGLFWTFANIAATVTYTLYMKRLTTELGTSIGRYGPVYYNNLLSLPFFAFAGITEFVPLATGLHEAPPTGQLCFVAVTLISACMTFTVFWCMEMTSPTTFSVAGALNKVPLAFIGMLVFQQFPDGTGYVGIAMALGGGFVYAYLNSHAGKKKEKEPEGEGARGSSTASPALCAMSASHDSRHHPQPALKDLV